LILTKYIFKDILKVQVACLIVLSSIFLCQTVIKLLGNVTSGTIPVNVLLELVLYTMPSVGFILIPMTLYVGIIVSLSRMSSESEMVVMKSVGVSTIIFMKLALVLATVSAVVTGFNTLYLLPHATNEQKVLKDSAQNNPKYLPIESGKFTDLGDFTLYIQKVQDNDNKKELKQIFIVNSQTHKRAAPIKDSVFLSSSSGHMKNDKEGVQWLTLDTGNTYNILGKGSELRKLNFNTFSIPMLSADVSNIRDDSLQAVPTDELLIMNDQKAGVELQWRISPIIACFVLAIIAIPLSMVNPRQGKFARLGPAIVIFISYYLALMAARNLLNSGKVGLYPGLYLVPVIFIIFVAIPLNMERKRGGFKKKTDNKNKKELTR